VTEGSDTFDTTLETTSMTGPITARFIPGGSFDFSPEDHSISPRRIVRLFVPVDRDPASWTLELAGRRAFVRFLEESVLAGPLEL